MNSNASHIHSSKSRFQQLLPDGIALLMLIVFGVLVLGGLIFPSAKSSVYSVIQWDTFEYHYYMLMYFSDSIRGEGMMPLYNPFAWFGNPFFCDPQTQMWSPITWAIAKTVGYSLKVLQFQIVFLFLIAGTGTYLTVRSFGHRIAVAWIAGISFMFCGYMIGHVNHLGTFSTLVWFPWVALFAHQFLKAEDRSCWAWAILAGAMLGQCSVQGHPTTAFLGALNLSAFVFFFPSSLTAHSKIKKILGLVLVAIIAALVSAPQIYGLVWAQDQFIYFSEPRFGVDESVANNALGPRNLISMILPGIAQFNFGGPFHQIDVTMIPSSIGLLMLVGCFVALIRSLHLPIVRLLAILGLLNLMMAMGPFFSLRTMSFFGLPLFKMPHHPSLDFRGYWLFFSVLLGCLGIRHIASWITGGMELPIKRLALMIGFLAAFFGVAGIVLISFGGSQEMASQPTYHYTRIGGAKLIWGEELVLQSILLFIMAAIFWMVTLRLRRTSSEVIRSTFSRQAIAALIIFAAIDVSSITIRNWPIMASKATPEYLNQVIGAEANRSVTLEPNQFTQYNRDSIKNTGLVEKYVNLSAYNPIAVIDGEFQGLDQAMGFMNEKTDNRLYVADPDDNPITAKATLVELTPQGWTVDVETPESGTLRLIATWTKDWFYRVDGGEWKAIEKSSYQPHGSQYFEAPVPAGQSTVEMKMRPPLLKASIIVMLLGYLAALLSGVFLFLPRKNSIE